MVEQNTFNLLTFWLAIGSAVVAVAAVVFSSLAWFESRTANDLNRKSRRATLDVTAVLFDRKYPGETQEDLFFVYNRGPHPAYRVTLSAKPKGSEFGNSITWPELAPSQRLKEAFRAELNDVFATTEVSLIWYDGLGERHELAYRDDGPEWPPRGGRD